MKNPNLCFGSFALLAAACSSSTPATSDDYDDVAQALGSVAASGDSGGESASFSDATQVAVGTPPFGFSADAAGKLSGKHGSLSYGYTVACEDEEGAKLAACGAATDSASATVSWSGDLATANVTASIEHRAHLRLEAIHSGTVSIAGDGSFVLDMRFESAWRHIERDYHLGYTVSYDGVEMRELPRSVVGGAIHYTVSAERKASNDTKQTDATFQIAADLEFSSDGSTQLTLDGTHHYRVDMITGVVTKQSP